MLTPIAVVLQLAQNILVVAVPTLIVLAFLVSKFPVLNSGTTMYFLHVLACLITLLYAGKVGVDRGLSFEQVVALLGIVFAVFALLTGAASLAISYDEYLAREKREKAYLMKERFEAIVED